MKKIALVILLLAAAAGAAWWFDLPQRFGWQTGEQKEFRLYGNVDLTSVHQLLTGPTATGEALGQVLEVEGDIGGAFGL